MKFKDSDIVSMQDFNKEDISELLKYADYASKRKLDKPLSGNVLANLFYEPSTRTRLSFETAMKRLGGSVISIDSTQASSIAKGESLADTVRVLEGYSDIIVLRHPKEGAAKMAAEFSKKPVINAGDGSNEHPTQTLTDLYTIWKEKDKIKNLKIAVLGDLKYGRTVHSLVLPLSKYEVKIYLISPQQLRIRSEWMDRIQENKAEVSEKEELRDIIKELDIIYVTRIQKERFADVQEYEKVAGYYKIDKEILKKGKDELKIMHPLPRVDEISPEVDETENAKYFDQSANGVKIRSALLYKILGG